MLSLTSNYTAASLFVLGDQRYLTLFGGDNDLILGFLRTTYGDLFANDYSVSDDWWHVYTRPFTCTSNNNILSCANGFVGGQFLTENRSGKPGWGSNFEGTTTAIRYRTVCGTWDLFL
jgi:hypothetical protein